MPYWRWFVIVAMCWGLVVAAGTNSIIFGLLAANLVAPLWALRVHVILDTPERITDADLMALLNG